jgi:hypothetical protein
VLAAIVSGGSQILFSCSDNEQTVFHARIGKPIGGVVLQFVVVPAQGVTKSIVIPFG